MWAIRLYSAKPLCFKTANQEAVGAIQVLKVCNDPHYENLKCCPILKNPFLFFILFLKPAQC